MSTSKNSRGPARRAKYVAEFFGFSQPMLYKEIGKSNFPPGTYVTENGMRIWFDDELEAEMCRRITLYNGDQQQVAS